MLMTINPDRAALHPALNATRRATWAVALMSTRVSPSCPAGLQRGHQLGKPPLEVLLSLSGACASLHSFCAQIRLKKRF
ncbi:MAG: hypothetical protein MZW92_54065 [Comamonadaceae bacterium]|nr:hypothetical protein [Comamonadaceae bacterium]